MLAEDFVEFGSSGRIFGRREIIESLRDEPPIQRTLTDFHATALAPGVILVTYRIVGVTDLASRPTHALRSSIWKLIEGRWQMVFHQGTLASDAPQRRTGGERAEFESLLAELAGHPEREGEIAARIDARFGRDRAVMALDMSGFSRTTQRLGIVSFLSMIHRMQRIAVPCIGAAHGRVLKAEADNLLSVFDTVDDAVLASRAIVARSAAENARQPDERRLHVSIGIGYGRVLDIGGEDVFGAEVNLASKLGEDIAGMGEVLLTSGAKVHLKSAPVALSEQSVSVSGLVLTYYRAS